MPPKDKYTDPKLREEVKEDIKKSDKGGAPGQWSARKAQMMASEYKKRGGDYNTDKSEQDESQKNLSKWGEEDWQTKEGSGDAKKEDGTQKRYLPKKAWENMTEEEKEETEKEKQKGSKQGKQFVGNTDKAKESREKANKDESDKYDKKKDDEKKAKKQPQEGTRKSTRNQNKSDDKAPKKEEESKKESDDDSTKKQGTKRGKEDKEDDSSDKKQKTSHGKDGKSTYGSKHQSTEAPAKQGANDRLPKKGQKVTWKAMPGWVEGEVVEVLKKEKEVDGKKVKASDKEPRIVLKSSSSGKIAVHKPDAVFFD